MSAATNHETAEPAAQQAEGQTSGSDAQAKVAEVAGQAQEKVGQAAGQLQGRITEQLDQRSTQVAEQISERASDLRSVSETLRSQGKEGPAKAADQLAGYAERAGGYLRERDSKTILADLEDLGRRQPLAAAAGGLLLGFAASRFLKASSRQRYAGRLTVERPAGVYTSQRAGGGNGVASRPEAGSVTPPARTGA